jgi:Response regulators consisting of a CheY-like receiver domain and a winged-helix DNA-binding domain
MPEFDGLDVCREVEILDVPILFLSARDDEIDRVLGSRSVVTIMSQNRSARANSLRG